ncbi:MAG: hypothetical protein Kow00109_18680 [Acidobacteriota bacterium]
MVQPGFPARVLVVDDDHDLGDALADFLQSRGLQVKLCRSVEEARQALLQGGRFHILLTDLRLPDGDGLEIMRLAKEQHPDILCALMTGYASLESALEAIRLGAYDYITKPFGLSEIEILIRNMCDKLALENETRRARKEIQEANDRLREIYARVDALQEEKLELMKLGREMKREFAALSNKVDQLAQMLQLLFPQTQRIRWADTPADKLLK